MPRAASTISSGHLGRPLLVGEMAEPRQAHDPGAGQQRAARGRASAGRMVPSLLPTTSTSGTWSRGRSRSSGSQVPVRHHPERGRDVAAGGGRAARRARSRAHRSWSPCRAAAARPRPGRRHARRRAAARCRSRRAAWRAARRSGPATPPSGSRAPFRLTRQPRARSGRPGPCGPGWRPRPSGRPPCAGLTPSACQEAPRRRPPCRAATGPRAPASTVKPWPGRSGATTVKCRASSGARSRQEWVAAPVPCTSRTAGPAAHHLHVPAQGRRRRRSGWPRGWASRGRPASPVRIEDGLDPAAAPLDRSGRRHAAARARTCERARGIGIGQRQVAGAHLLAPGWRACGCGLRRGVDQEAVEPRRRARRAAAASASSSARARPGRAVAGDVGPAVGEEDQDRASRPCGAPRRPAPAAASIPAASGVPPPPGRPARLRLARTSERVGGRRSSAPRPRKASRATWSRRT